MDCSMPGFPVLYHLLKLAQVHVHCIGDAIQPSHSLTLSSPSVLNLSPIVSPLKKKKKKRLFIWLLQVLVAACGIFFFFWLRHVGSSSLIEPELPALGVWSPSHWIAREVPPIVLLN